MFTLAHGSQLIPSAVATMVASLAAVAWCIFCGYFVARRHGAPRTTKANRCSKCGYSLAGLDHVGLICPECGTKHALRRRSPSSSLSFDIMGAIVAAGLGVIVLAFLWYGAIAILTR